MSVKITFEAANANLLYKSMADFLALAHDPNVTPAADAAKEAEARIVEPAKPKRKRRTKAEMEAARQAEAAPAPAPVADTSAPEVEGEELPTADELREVLKSVHLKHGITGSRAVLSRFGVSRLGELKENQYVEFKKYATWALDNDPTTAQESE